MSHLCKASKKKLAHDAEKVAERQEAGKVVYQCVKCRRMSHKEEHLCKPEKLKPPKAAKEQPAPAVEDASATEATPVAEQATAVELPTLPDSPADAPADEVAVPV